MPAATCLPSLQDYLHARHPDQYASAKYTSLEISPKLAAIQEQRVLGDGKHSSCYKVSQHDAVTATAWGVASEQPCVILLMEVLDNLPHDRLLSPALYAMSPRLHVLQHFTSVQTCVVLEGNFAFDMFLSKTCA